MFVTLAELRHRVTIKRPTVTIDEEGNIIENSLVNFSTRQRRKYPTAIWSRSMKCAIALSFAIARILK